MDKKIIQKYLFKKGGKLYDKVNTSNQNEYLDDLLIDFSKFVRQDLEMEQIEIQLKMSSKGKLIKKDGIYMVSEIIGKTIIATTDHELSKLVNHRWKLSLKNCQEIEESLTNNSNSTKENEWDVDIEEEIIEEDVLDIKGKIIPFITRVVRCHKFDKDECLILKTIKNNG